MEIKYERGDVERLHQPRLRKSLDEVCLEKETLAKITALASMRGERVSQMIEQLLNDAPIGRRSPEGKRGVSGARGRYGNPGPTGRGLDELAGLARFIVRRFLCSKETDKRIAAQLIIDLAYWAGCGGLLNISANGWSPDIDQTEFEQRARRSTR